MLKKRDILKKIIPAIERPEAIMIKGTRRVGKSSLLALIKRHLIKKCGVDNHSIFSFDLEDLNIRTDLNDKPENISKYIGDLDSQKYLFLDEIQYLERPSNFIKILVDHYPKIKIFATGSSSLDIKSKIEDSLVGRVRYFHLYPLNFLEFLNFKNKKFPLSPTTNQQKELNSLLSEYVTYGGMPAVVLEQKISEKINILKDYVSLYINKDIRNITKIDNITAYNKLMILLADQCGKQLDKVEICNTINIAFQTLERYLSILENTYVIKIINPFLSNIRSKLTKTPKIYLYDLGLRNELLNNYNDFYLRSDKGWLFENFVLLQLLSKYPKDEINYYRTTNQTEIDFIFEKEKYAIEVKAKKMKKVEIFKTFEQFNNYKNFVINFDFNKEERNYKFIDWWQWVNS